MSSTVETPDIVLAAYLKAAGYRMSSIIRQGNRGTFVFSDVPTQVVEDYDLGQTLVEPKALHAEIRALTTAARR